MYSPHFLDPFGSHLPALERTVLRIRAIETVLVLFHVEELKQAAIDCIRATDRFGKVQRLPEGTPKALNKALAILVLENALTNVEKEELIELIDYRNAAGHEIHTLFADLSSGRFARNFVRHMKGNPKYQFYRADALARLRFFRTKFNDLGQTHHYVRTINMRPVLFEAAERFFTDELKRLKKRASTEAKARSSEIAKLNRELSIKGLGLEGHFSPAGPYSQYDDGRLTQIGVEICYRLFDSGKSDLAVAHLTRISLASVRKRRKQWTGTGGKKRKAADLKRLPTRKFYRRDDD
jgi:hypothetical protein